MILTLDFETYYAKDYTLKKLTTEEYIRDERFAVHGVGMKVNDEASFYIWTDIAGFLKSIDWSSAYVLCHNTRFDGAILSWRYGIRPKFLLDTMSMARAVFPHESSSLANLSKLCGLGEKGHDLESFMGKRDLTEEEQVRLGLYCMNDVDLTYKLFQHMKNKFQPSELKVIDQTLRMFTEPVLELDTKVLEGHLVKLQEKRTAVLSGYDITSLRSGPKFAALLRSLGVEPPMKISAKTKKPAFAFAKTDEGMTELLEHEDEEVQILAAARLGGNSSIEETRTKRFLGIASRGPLPAPLNYCGAKNTFRFGGAEKINLQNLSKVDPLKADSGALRKAIVAPDGCVLVVADFNAIEARVLALQAEQVDLLDQFQQGADIYCAFAARTYAREITKKENPKERAIGKASILGLGFGMGWKKAAGWFLSGPLGMPPIAFSKGDLDAMGGYLMKLDTNGVTKKLKGVELQAHCSATKHLVDSYRHMYTKIPDYWKTCNRMLDCMHRGVKRQFGVLSTDHERMILPNGLSIYYKGLCWEDKKEEDENGFGSWWYFGKKGRQEVKQRIHGPKFAENGVQAIARILMTDAMLKIGERFRVCLTVHDEIVCCVKEEEADEALKYMIEVMAVAPGWCKDLPLTGSGGVAKSYGEVEK